MTAVRSHAAHRPPGPLRRAGLTLTELALSMTVMTILLGATASAVLLATRALPIGDSTAERLAKTADVVSEIADDLNFATSFSVATDKEVIFTVPDRAHGAEGPETIRYAWSGTPGDPLTREYNGGLRVNVVESVDDFAIEYGRAAKRLTGPPSVLLIVDNEVSPSADDLARQTQIESWGFPVQILSDYHTLPDYEAAMVSVDVVYISEETSTRPALLSSSMARGIVCEERSLFPDLGISQRSNWLWIVSIDILDNTHEITSPFALGTLQIISPANYGIYSFSQIAEGGQILATDGSAGCNMLMAIDVDRALSGGGTAPARRVSLPWGDQTFDFNDLTPDALTLMRRAIIWAAAPVVYESVHVTLQNGPDSSHRAGTEVLLVNRPRVP